MKGPRPTPTAILRQRGSWRAAKRADYSPAACHLEPPNDILPAARERFSFLAELFSDRTTPADVQGLQLLAESLHFYAKACRDIEVNGVAVSTKSGGVKSNPALALRASTWSEIVRLLAAFGATPADRARICLSGLDKTDPQVLQFFPVNSPAVVPGDTRSGVQR